MPILIQQELIWPTEENFIQLGASSILALVLAVLLLRKATHKSIYVLWQQQISQFFNWLRLLQRCTDWEFGFTRAASLIRQARQEVKNSVLVDNGDLIQGNPIADYQAAKGYKEGKSNPAVDRLNAMHYEVGTLGKPRI